MNVLVKPDFTRTKTLERGVRAQNADMAQVSVFNCNHIRTALLAGGALFGADLSQAADAAAARQLFETVALLSDFGATEDNPDNSVELQNAASSGKNIIVDGNYAFSSTIDMDTPATRFESGVRKLRYTGTGYAIRPTIVGDAKWAKPPSVVGNACKTITAITKANPAVVTCANHGLTTGTEISFGEILGMAELDTQFGAVTVIDANTFSIAIDTTLYGDFESGWCIKYTNNHRGIFYQASTFSPTNEIRWMENFDLDGVVVEGFGDTGVRLDWVKNIRGHVTTNKCGYGGVIVLSIDGFYGRVDANYIGPGSGGTCYTLSASRAYSSPVLSITWAPRSKNIFLVNCHFQNCPRYVGVDTHGGENIIMLGTRFDNIGVPVNLEHASGGGSLVSANNIYIQIAYAKGPNPAYFDTLPLAFLDAQSGADEMSEGVTIEICGKIENYGFSNHIGKTIFTNGAVIYAQNLKNSKIVFNCTFENCAKRIVYLGENTDLDLSGIKVKDLIASGGIQYVVESAASTGKATVDNISLDGAGYILKAAHSDTLRVGANLTCRNAGKRWDGSTSTVLKVGAGLLVDDFEIMIDGATGLEKWSKYRYNDYGLAFTRVSTGIYTVNVNALEYNNARIALWAAAQGAYTISLTNVSNSTCEIRVYNSAGVLIDVPDLYIKGNGA